VAVVVRHSGVKRFGDELHPRIDALVELALVVFVVVELFT
jgi:hypothetical protein